MIQRKRRGQRVAPQNARQTGRRHHIGYGSPESRAVYAYVAGHEARHRQQTHAYRSQRDGKAALFGQKRRQALRQGLRVPLQGLQGDPQRYAQRQQKHKADQRGQNETTNEKTHGTRTGNGGNGDA